MAVKRVRVGNAFGIALAEARQAAGVSQEELGARAHYGQNYISMLETGRRQPSISAVMALENALALEAGELVRKTKDALGKALKKGRWQKS